ncbi:MAG: hypothetical protein JWP01_3103 [Myxococcales bacterium]|nr:hypothetical protein [Myxococcales bacterium]
MPSFRETLWFKVGLRDEVAAAAAAGSDAERPSAQLLPLEDRYLDDASLTSEDRAQLSLRTGQTTLVPRLDVTSPEPSVPVTTLVGELKRGRGTMIAMIAATTACVGGAVLLLAM